MNPANSRPFGLPVDTRLPVSQRGLWGDPSMFRAPIVMGSYPVQFVEPISWADYFRVDFRAAFRNAEASEASE